MSNSQPLLESSENSRNFVSERLNMRALEIDFRTDTRWQSFVEAHPNGSIYHHPRWLDVLEKEYGHKIIALTCENGFGQLRALLPLAYTKGLPLHIGGQSAARRLASLPRTPVGGTLSLDRVGAAVVLRAAIERVRHDPGMRLQIKTDEAGLDKLADGLICKPWRLTYVLNLPSRSEDLRLGQQGGQGTSAGSSCGDAGRASGLVPALPPNHAPQCRATETLSFLRASLELDAPRRADAVAAR